MWWYGLTFRACYQPGHGWFWLMPIWLIPIWLMPIWYLSHAYMVFGSCLFGIWLMLKDRVCHFDIGNPVAYSAKHSERLSHRPQQQLLQCTVAQWDHVACEHCWTGRNNSAAHTGRKGEYSNWHFTWYPTDNRAVLSNPEVQNANSNRLSFSLSVLFSEPSNIDGVLASLSTALDNDWNVISWSDLWWYAEAGH